MTADYFQHPFYSYIDHQLDPLLDLIRDRASAADSGWRHPEVRGALDAVRAALDVLQEDLLPEPLTEAQAAVQGLTVSAQHRHDGQPEDSWCVRVGPAGARRLLWHVAYIPELGACSTRRRVSGPRGWVRAAWGNEDAVAAVASKVFDGESDTPYAEPWPDDNDRAGA